MRHPRLLVAADSRGRGGVPGLHLVYRIVDLEQPRREPAFLAQLLEAAESTGISDLGHGWTSAHIVLLPVIPALVCAVGILYAAPIPTENKTINLNPQSKPQQ